MQAAYHDGAGDSPRLHAGDWLVVPFPRIAQQTLGLDPDAVTVARTIDVDDPVPLRTVMSYYHGRTGLDRREGPRFRVTVYRVTRDFTP